MRNGSYTLFILAIAGLLLLSTSWTASADDRFEDEEFLPYYYGVSNFYQAPEEEVLAVRSRLAPEEVSVAFHIASEAGVSPIEVAEARAAGSGWMEVGRRYGVGPEAYYVPLKRAPEPPYGNAWGYYRNRPRSQWDTIRLTDREVIDLVNLRFLHEHYGLDRHDIVHRRALGEGHHQIVTDVWKHDVRHKGRKGHVTDRWYPGGHPRDRYPRDARPHHGKRGHGHDRDGHRRDRDGAHHGRDGGRDGKRGHGRDGGSRLF